MIAMAGKCVSECEQSSDGVSAKIVLKFYFHVQSYKKNPAGIKIIPAGFLRLEFPFTPQ